MIVGIVCAASSVVLRLLSYIFLRIIPATLAPVMIATMYFVYASSFLLQWQQHRDVKRAEKSKKVEGWSKSSGSTLLALFLGTPVASGKLSTSSFFVNTLLLLLSMDLTFHSRLRYPSNDTAFIRVGYVSPTMAKVVVRMPVDHTVELTYRRQYADAARNLTFLPLAASDYVTTLELTGLAPSTVYDFSAAHMDGGLVTPPQDQRGKFSFLSTSCIKARFPYNPFDHPLYIPGFMHLANALTSIAPSFMLFLGDFIYIDVPHRFGSDAEAYRREYRQIYASPSWGDVGRIPWLHVYDDHEILNDYDSSKDPGNMFANGIEDAFWHYQHLANPPPVRDTTYYQFDQQGVGFFMLDTRRYRSAERMPDGPSKSMLGEQQKSDLIRWLQESRQAWKVIISSCPFTQNWRGPDGKLDTWGGYLTERQEILDIMHRVGGVVILSGDRHEFAATRFPAPSPFPESHAVYEYSTSPLSQFYLRMRRQNSDEKVAYIPDGNSKFGHIEVDTSDDQAPKLSFTLYVDGQKKWSHHIQGPPIQNNPSRGKDIQDFVEAVSGCAQWTWKGLAARLAGLGGR